MDHPSTPSGASADGERPSPEASAWETRLLALNALVDLAREHAGGRSVAGDRSYTLEHALHEVRQAVGAPQLQHAEAVDAAVYAFGEALASLSTKSGRHQ